MTTNFFAATFIPQMLKKSFISWNTKWDTTRERHTTPLSFFFAFAEVSKEGCKPFLIIITCAKNSSSQKYLFFCLLDFFGYWKVVAILYFASSSRLSTYSLVITFQRSAVYVMLLHLGPFLLIKLTKDEENSANCE